MMVFENNIFKYFKRQKIDSNSPNKLFFFLQKGKRKIKQLFLETMSKKPQMTTVTRKFWKQLLVNQSCVFDLKKRAGRRENGKIMTCLLLVFKTIFCF